MSKPIDQIPEADRPREKLLRKGAKALSDQELLAVLLGKGTPGMDVMTLAGKLARLIDEKGLEVQAGDLLRFEGVGEAKATLIRRRSNSPAAESNLKVSGSKRQRTYSLRSDIMQTVNRSTFSAPRSTARTRF